MGAGRCWPHLWPYPQVSIGPRPGQSAHFIPPGPQGLSQGWACDLCRSRNYQRHLLEAARTSWEDLPEMTPSPRKAEELGKGKRPDFLNERWIQPYLKLPDLQSMKICPGLCCCLTSFALNSVSCHQNHRSDFSKSPRPLVFTGKSRETANSCTNKKLLSRDPLVQPLVPGHVSGLKCF